MDAKKRLRLVHDQLDMLEKMSDLIQTASAADVIRIIRDVAGPRVEEATCAHEGCGKPIHREQGGDWKHGDGYHSCALDDRVAWPGYDD